MNKKFVKRLWHAITLVLIVSMLFSFASCGEVPLETGDSDTLPFGETLELPAQTTKAPEESTEETTDANDPMADGKLRVMIVSDTHYTYRKTWYGVKEDVRMQHWVDSVKAEHAKSPYDLIIVSGDTSLDHWGNGGSWLKDNRSTAKEFVDKYVSQLPEEIPVFVMTGNHEAFKEETWFELTGHHRKGTIVMGNNVFILVDSFTNNLEPEKDYASSHFKSPIDVEWIQEQIDANPNKNVFLISHYFDYSNSYNSGLKQLLTDNDQIVCLFESHVHKPEIIKMGANYGDKYILRTGNFSYSGYDENGTGDAETLMNSFWGWRELEISGTTASSHYLIVESQAAFSGKLQNVPRQETNKMEFSMLYPCAD